MRLIGWEPTVVFAIISRLCENISTFEITPWDPRRSTVKLAMPALGCGKICRRDARAAVGGAHGQARSTAAHDHLWECCQSAGGMIQQNHSVGRLVR